MLAVQLWLLTCFTHHLLFTEEELLDYFMNYFDEHSKRFKDDLSLFFCEMEVDSLNSKILSMNKWE